MRIAGLVCLLVVSALADDRADLLREGDWIQRNRLLDDLTEAPAAAAVPLLIEALQFDDTFIAARAAQMLRLYGDEARPAVPALIQALYHEVPRVRRYAYETLEWLGRAAEGASPFVHEVRRRLGRNIVLRLPDYRSRVPLTAPPYQHPAPADRETALKGIEFEGWLDRGRAATALGRHADREEDYAALVRLLNDPSPYVRAKAADALVAKHAAAHIESALRDGSLRVRRRLADALAWAAPCPTSLAPALAALCEEQDRPSRLAAIAALAQCGREASGSVAGLVPLMESDDGELREAMYLLLSRVPPGSGAIEVMVRVAGRSQEDAARIVSLLGGMGEEAHPALIGLLEGGSTEVRVRICYDLVRARKPTPAVLATLEKAKRDPEEKVRQAAAGALARLPEPDTATAAELLAELKTTDDLRRLALLCHRLFGRADESIDPIALLDDEHWQLRYYALTAIARTPGRRPELINKIKALVTDENVHVRRQVPVALRVVSLPRADDVAGLIEELGSGDLDRVQEAMRALGFAPQLAGPAIPALVELVRTGDKRTRNASLGLLKRLGAPAVKATVELLRDSDGRLRHQVRDALGSMPRAAVVDAVKALRSDADAQVRIEAARLLRRHAQYDALVEWLDDPSPAVRAEAARVFFEMRGARALPGLLRVMELENETLHRSALYALGRHKEAAARIIPVVAPYLEHRDEKLRQAAASTLGRMGRPADAIVDRALAASEPALRASALSGIRGRPDGVDLLKRAFGDEAVEVRVAACRMCRSWKEAELLLVEAIRDRTPEVAREALEVATRLNPVPESAIPGAIEALDSSVARYRARGLLARLFPASVKALLAEAAKLRKDSIREAFRSFGVRVVPYLLDELKGDRRREAIWALGTLGRDGRDAAVDLKELAAREPALAEEIAAALKRIEG